MRFLLILVFLLLLVEYNAHLLIPHESPGAKIPISEFNTEMIRWWMWFVDVHAIIFVGLLIIYSIVPLEFGKYKMLALWMLIESGLLLLREIFNYSNGCISPLDFFVGSGVCVWVWFILKRR